MFMTFLVGVGMGMGMAERAWGQASRSGGYTDRWLVVARHATAQGDTRSRALAVLSMSPRMGVTQQATCVPHTCRMHVHVQNTTWPHPGHAFINAGVAACSMGCFAGKGCLEDQFPNSLDLLILENMQVWVWPLGT